jgi:hypothetical protein
MNNSDALGHLIDNLRAYLRTWPDVPLDVAERWRLLSDLMDFARQVKRCGADPAATFELLRPNLERLGLGSYDVSALTESASGPRLVGSVLLVYQEAEQASKLSAQLTTAASKLERSERPPSQRADDREAAAFVVRMADVKRERVEWLWPGRIPRGKLVLLDGDPDLGKTTVALDLAARITRGHSMPDDTVGGAPGNVLLMMAEDGLADTIRPRLDAAGADLNRVFALRGIPAPNGGERLPMLPDDGDMIRAEVERFAALAVFLDPLFAYVSPVCNIFRDQDVRRALQPLVRIGEDSGCAVIVLRHLNKAPRGGSGRPSPPRPRRRQVQPRPEGTGARLSALARAGRGARLLGRSHRTHSRAVAFRGRRRGGGRRWARG